MHRPVCCKCSIEMICDKNGVKAIEKYKDDGDRIYRIWDSDMYKCPECGILILYGFGNGAYVYDYEDDFSEELKRVKKEEVYQEFV